MLIPSLLNGLKYNDAGHSVIIFSRLTLTNSVAEPKYTRLDKLVLSGLRVTLRLFLINALFSLGSSLYVSNE